MMTGTPLRGTSIPFLFDAAALLAAFLHPNHLLE
ncbi:Uncharacterised protein [Yersinia thracica]|uniref:Uncharacterized protein n=1 Tax=Yersinia thracica TaxID=2890319 RepID=A0A0T9P0X5_9GAMM|nr:Uncharacterised protein [Yersinia thracica]